MPESTQECLSCGEGKPLGEYRVRKPEYAGQCRACRKLAANAAYMARHREANREAVNAAQRAFKAANPDRIRQYRRDFRARHHERMLLVDKAYREANKAKMTVYFEAYYELHHLRIKQAAKEWRLANPERYRELKHRRRARERNAVTEPVDVVALWTGRCGICGDPIDESLRRPDLMSRSLDHVIPLCKGGSHSQENLQWTHLRCNLRKGSKVP